MVSFLSAQLAVLALVACQIPAAYAQEFDWTSLAPSVNLSWVSCYGTRQCANFQVPLDYSNPSGGSAVIAILKIPSALAPGSAGYGGPVLFNPGGPGISGVEFILESGDVLAQIVGTQFDVIGFDPRGVANSTPRISFIRSEAELLALRVGKSENVEATTPAFEIPKLLAQSAIVGQVARDRDTTGILSHVTTDNVARDMLRIVEAYGYQKLKFWGFSYGTVIGATFAAMFPNRVERMILDGTLDMEAYYNDFESPKDLADILRADNAVLQMFFDGCFEAGPSACAFYESSPQKIAKKLSDLVASVRAKPIPVYDGPDAPFGILDYTRLQDAIFQSLFGPYFFFSSLAQGLAQLAAGNASPIFHATDVPPGSSNGVESDITIWCSDSVSKAPATVEYWTQYYQSIKNVSPFAGAVMNTPIRCTGWRIHPNHFSGPIAGNTSFPLLIIGNTADPSTPIIGGIKTAKAFPGSVLLRYNIAGHTTIPATSACVYQRIGAYFGTGALPPAGTVCERDAGQPLFPPAGSAVNNNTRRAPYLRRAL